MASSRQHRIQVFDFGLPAAPSAPPPQQAQHQRWLGTATALAFVFILTVVAIPASQGQTFRVIHAFSGGQDGANPFAGLTMDSAGSLYGTTYNGGAGYGVAFELTHLGSV